ncbi:polymorphic toxin type 50 domain-containing protein [Peptostreptococcus anaerobius]|nr:polymorphic toxin type 50 domain-containing protein [Peptostreptococcus anaerobius]
MNKNWGKKEFIMSNKVVGYDVDPVTGGMTPTRYFSIHYSGVHT